MQYIQVVYSRLRGPPGAYFWHQMIELVDDVTHVVKFIENGPSNPITSIENPSAIGDALNAATYGGQSPYGTIEATIGSDAVPSSYFGLDPEMPRITVASGKDLSSIWEGMEATAENINKAALPYSPLTQNCGNVVSTILDEAGIGTPSSGSLSGHYTPGGKQNLLLDGSSMSAQESALENLQVATTTLKVMGAVGLAVFLVYETAKIEEQIKSGDLTGAANTINSLGVTMLAGFAGAAIGSAPGALAGGIIGGLIAGPLGFAAGEAIGALVAPIIVGATADLIWQNYGHNMDIILGTLISKLQDPSSAIATFARNHPILTDVALLPIAPGQTIFDLARNAFSYAHADPVVLDLTGNGLNIVPLGQSTTYFDAQNNGEKALTAWAGDGTAFLVQTSGSNVILIKSLSDLIEIDSNGDTILNNSDPAFQSLGVWQDLNQNGVADPGEVHSLIQMGITSLSLQTSGGSQDLGNSYVVGSILATMDDGTTRQVSQVELATDTMRVEQSFDGEFDTTPSLSLFLNAYGSLKNLTDAASNSPSLSAAIDTLRFTPVSDNQQFNNNLVDLLFKWADITGTSSSKDDIFSNSKLDFMNAFFGEMSSFVGGSSSPTLQHQGSFLQQGWDTIFAGMKSRILVQLPSSPVYGIFVYDPVKDVILPTSSWASAISTLAGAMSHSSITDWISMLGVVSESIYDADNYSVQDHVSILDILQNVSPSAIDGSVLKAVASGDMRIVEASSNGSVLYRAESETVFVIDQSGEIVNAQRGGGFILVCNGIGNLDVRQDIVDPGDTLVQMDSNFQCSTVLVSSDQSGDLVVAISGQSHYYRCRTHLPG